MKKRALCLFLTLVLIIGVIPMGAAAAHYHSYSEALVDIIKEYEGFVPKAYYDVDHWSIGYGTPSHKGETIDEEEADEALRDFLDGVEDEINDFADANKLNLSQGQFDALVSFTYNCGSDWMKVSGRFRTAVLKGYSGNDFLAAISLWANKNSIPDEVLLNRRLSEADMYLNGEYNYVKDISKNTKFGYVIFDANGGRAGSNGEDKMQAFRLRSGADIMVENPTRKGYDFLGWFTSPKGGTEVEELSSKVSGKTLYAHWDGDGEDDDDDFEWGVVTGSGVNIRKGPGTSYQAIGTATKGASIRIYRQVNSSGMRWGETDKGWICMNYVDLDEEPYDPEEEGGEGIVISGTGLKVRSGPGTDYKQVGSLRNGASVTIIETTRRSGAEWGRIGRNEWVCMQYIQMKGSPSYQTGVVDSRTNLSVRSGPGTDCDKVDTLKPGTKVTIYQTTYTKGVQWGRIGNNRWVCMNYIDVDGHGGSEHTAWVTAQSGLRIRSGAGTGYAIVGSLKYNERVTVTKITAVNGIEWGQIGKGWICLDYVKFK